MARSFAKRGALVLAALGAGAIAPTPALAYDIDTFWPYGGDLSAGAAYAGTAAHSQVRSVYVVSNHTVCAALAQGYSGFTFSPFSGGHSTYIKNGTTAACAPTVYWAPNPSSTYLHGAAYNPNVRTTDHISTATWSWGF